MIGVLGNENFQLFEFNNSEIIYKVKSRYSNEQLNKLLEKENLKINKFTFSRKIFHITAILMKQNILKFNFRIKSKEFFVNDKNYFAYNLVKSWPNWNNQFVYIYGLEKCGKTSITEIWKEKIRSQIFKDVVKILIRNCLTI